MTCPYGGACPVETSTVRQTLPLTRPTSLSAPTFVLGALALWLLASIAWRPLLLPDEGRYAGVAWEMLVGDGLTPTLDGLPFFHKPPLSYWVAMGAMKLFGVQPWAARLAPALGAWLMAASLWLLLRRWYGERSAGLGVLVLATSPFFFIGGQYINHDMLVAGTISAAVVGWLLALDEPGRIERRALLLGWLASGLAFLSKGLIGVVLPLLVVVPWLLAQRRWRDALRLAHPLGLLVWCVVALPWAVAMQQQHPAFFDYFIVGQHFRRYSSGGFNNVQPLWFFLAVVPLLTLPWSLYLPAALRRLRGADARALLWPWWAASLLLFFSLPSSKLVGYALPALPGVAGLVAVVAAEGRHWRVAVLLGAAIGLAAVGVLAWQAPGSHRDIALTLRNEMHGADRVVLVEGAFYDVPFYARLRTPAIVASRWDDPAIAQRDNWQKELHDAAGFASAATAQRQLWPVQRLAELPCADGAIWFVLHPGDSHQVAAIPGAVLVRKGANGDLWRAPERATCAAAPR